MARSFYEKLQAAQTQRESDLALLLSPKFLKMPAPIARYDDPFLPFGKAVVDATRDLVCAYIFDLAAYLTHGAAGAVALERTIAYVGADGSTITILHGPFWGKDYVEAASDRAFHVDAVTLVSEADVPAYLSEPGMAAFLVAQEFTQTLYGAGIYHPQDHWLRFYDRKQLPLKLRVLGDQALYGDGTDSFAVTIRAAVSAERAKA